MKRVVGAQGFDLQTTGIAVRYTGADGSKLVYEVNSNRWYYPASATKLVILVYAYYDAVQHRQDKEEFSKAKISDINHLISPMILSSSNEAARALAGRFDRANIRRFPRETLGIEGVETGWYGTGDRVTVAGMARLMDYVYDDRDCQALPLAAKCEIWHWLEKPKVGQLEIQNAPIQHFLTNSVLPHPYRPDSGLRIGMKSGWTKQTGSGNVACFDYTGAVAGRWSVAVFRQSNCSYFDKIGSLYRDLFDLFAQETPLNVVSSSNPVGVNTPVVFTIHSEQPLDELRLYSGDYCFTAAPTIVPTIDKTTIAFTGFTYPGRRQINAVGFAWKDGRLCRAARLKTPLNLTVVR